MSLVSERPILVTGASGYIALHVIRILLEKGYRVRGTVRSTKDPKKNTGLTSLPGASERLELVEADLTNASSFVAAMVGVEYVLHIASPYALTVVDPQRDLVDPAVNGTLSVLRAAYDAGIVKRVVLTSSCAAISDCYDNNHTYTEADWNETSSLRRNPYYFSKTQAEKAAWKFMEDQPGKFDLVVINPFVVLGPSLVSGPVNESLTFYKGLLSGEFSSGMPKLYFGVVDVRDVAQAHILALENPAAKGRYICWNRTLSLPEIVTLIRERFPAFNPRLPTRSLPNFLVRFAAMFQSAGIRDYLTYNVGRCPSLNNTKITKELGMTFRDANETILDSCQWLIENNHVSAPKK